MTIKRENISIAMMGYINSGKSTLLGHLIYKSGAIDKETIEKYEKEASEMGKGSLKYAWVLDKLKAERERGITIDTSTFKFQTQKYNVIGIDTPGHRDFIKNTIAGISQADVEILTISSIRGEFEAGISKDGQTREHALIAFTMGIKQLIVAINKMDDKTVAFSEIRFNEIKNEVSWYLAKVGYKPESIPFIPVSGFNGDNIIERSTNMTWYKGPILFEAIDQMKPPARRIDQPLRIPLLNIYKIGGVGTVAYGKIATGILKPGMNLTFTPSNNLSDTVGSMEMHHEGIQEAKSGDIVSFSVKNISVRELKRGFIASDLKNNPAKECESFIAQVYILNHPGEIKNGYTPVIDIHTTHVPCRMSLLKKIDKENKVLEETPKSIKSGDDAIIKFTPLKPLCVETFAEYPSLGRIVIRDMRIIVGVGVIKEVIKK